MLDHNGAQFIAKERANREKAPIYIYWHPASQSFVITSGITEWASVIQGSLEYVDTVNFDIIECSRDIAYKTARELANKTQQWYEVHTNGSIFVILQQNEMMEGFEHDMTIAPTIIPGTI